MNYVLVQLRSALRPLPFQPTTDSGFCVQSLLGNARPGGSRETQALVLSRWPTSLD